MSDLVTEYFRIMRTLGPDAELLKRIEVAEQRHIAERVKR